MQSGDQYDPIVIKKQSLRKKEISNQGCSRGRDLQDRDGDMGSRDQDRDRGH